jgi:NAD(P)-dependent dehydrogenase (short-subunit alcohol dehydrogenase family)
MTELADRVALVTGGACGQGRAHAVALAAAGATVSRAVLYLVTDPGRTSGSVLEVNLATSAVASEGPAR